jgi:hypothetical protein
MTNTKYIDFEGREWTKLDDHTIHGLRHESRWPCIATVKNGGLVYSDIEGAFHDVPVSRFYAPHLMRAAWDNLMEPEVPQTVTFTDADNVTWQQVGPNLIESEETDEWFASQMRRRADGKIECRAIGTNTQWTCAEDIFEALIPSKTTEPPKKSSSAADFLGAALGHMVDRAATYDKPQGERSMGNCVAAFNQLTGHTLTEEQGWLFMAVLKITRTQQGAFRADNYEDLAAYAGLAGEAAAKAKT